MKNKSKTILFASLIAAMVLPFSGMDFAQASSDNDKQDNNNVKKDSDKWNEKVHPSIDEYKEMNINVQEVKNQLTTNGQLDLTFNSTEYNLILSEFDMLSPDFTVQERVNGELVDVEKEDYKMYKGHVDGDNTSNVFVLVNTESVFADIRVADKLLTLESLKTHDKDAKSSKHILYEQSISKVPSISKTSGWELIPEASAAYDYMDVRLDCTKDFYDVNRSTWQSRMNTVFGAVNNELYHSTYGTNVVMLLNGQTCDTTGTTYTTTTDHDDLWNEIKDEWDDKTAHRHAVILFTDRTTPPYKGYSGPNTTVGLAPALDANDKGYAYVTTKDRSTQQVKNIFMHEVGHLLGATHADSGVSPLDHSSRTTYYSIMDNGRDNFSKRDMAFTSDNVDNVDTVGRSLP